MRCNVTGASGESDIPLRASLLALLIAVASMGAFFLNYRFEPAVSCFVFPDPHPLAYPRFLAVMTARFFGATASVPLATAVGIPLILCAAGAFVILAHQLLRGQKTGNIQLISAVLLAFSILFAVDTAKDEEFCLGFAAARAPRYGTLLIPGVTGFYFYLRTISAGIRRAMVAVFILLLLPGCLIVDGGPAWFAEGKRAWAACYLLTEIFPLATSPLDLSFILIQIKPG